MPKRNGMKEAILATAATANGLDTGALATKYGFVRQTVCSVAWKMVQNGELVVHRVSHRHARYFTTQALADEFRAKQARLTPTPSRAKQRAQAAPWAPGTEAVIPDHVQVQRGPSYEPRFQAFEFPFIVNRK